MPGTYSIWPCLVFEASCDETALLDASPPLGTQIGSLLGGVSCEHLSAETRTYRSFRTPPRGYPVWLIIAPKRHDAPPRRRAIINALDSAAQLAPGPACRSVRAMSQVPTQPPPRPRQYELTVHQRDSTSTVELIPGSSLLIGRTAEADIVIDDSSVSRQHARLFIGSRIELEDLGSSNGTTLVRDEHAEVEESTASNTGPLPPHQRTEVRPGDVIRIGMTVMAIQHRGKPISLMPTASSTSGPIRLDPEMLRTHALVQRAASTEISILILGDTGVGKEVMAESIHRHSPRAGHTFLKLNCAALTASLLESELFGHERGAFTGAHATKAGLLESANGGTVFLDEIAELPLSTQAKLLRVLEERTVIRVGATKPKRINVRFIGATNRDLAQQVRAGEFRSDLYYRIAGLVVRIPPLRERPSEIEPLALHFFKELSRGCGKPEVRLTRAALDKLKTYAWPGNVRELRNVIERATLLATSGVADVEHILIEALDPFSSRPSDSETRRVKIPPGPTSVPANGSEDERARVMRALEEYAGNQTRAARALGISRRTLINRLEAFGLPRPRKS